MSGNGMEWLRLYHGTAFDVKLASVAKRAETHRTVSLALWIALLETASQADSRGSIANVDLDEVAIGLDLGRDVVDRLIVAFTARGMIGPDGMLEAWNRRQPKRDDHSTERVRAWRERQKATRGNADETPDETHTKHSGNAEGNAETPLESESESSPNGEDNRRRKRAARLPDDWVLTDEWAVEGEIARLNAGLPSIDLRVEADKFRDYWHAKSGKDAAKADWLATWRNWCRNARSPGPPPSRPSATSPPDRKSRLSDTLRRRIADADRQDDTTP